jgi:hypothetical protein
VPVGLVLPGLRPGATVTLRVDDSLALRARVTGAGGALLAAAPVRWTSSDPARVAVRGGWAVAQAAGGRPGTLTATTGTLRRTVRVAVAARPAAPAPVAAAPPPTAAPRAPRRPSADDVRGAVDDLVTLLRARDVDRLAVRLAPVAGDGSRSSAFLGWLSDAGSLRVGAPAVGAPSDEAEPRVAVRVPIAWRGGGLLRSGQQREATFWVSLVREGDGWRAGTVRLAGRFP